MLFVFEIGQSQTEALAMHLFVLYVGGKVCNSGALLLDTTCLGAIPQYAKMEKSKALGFIDR